MLNDMYGQNFISNRGFDLAEIANISVDIRLLASARGNSINIHISRKNFITTTKIEFHH